MKKYPYLFELLLGVLQLILTILTFKYYEYLIAVIPFTYPVLLLLIQNWKNSIKDK
jgi:hypothetical protein